MDGSCLVTYSGHTGPINAMVLSRDGLTLYTCSKDKTAKSYNVTSGVILVDFVGHKDAILCMTLGQDYTNTNKLYL